MMILIGSTPAHIIICAMRRTTNNTFIKIEFEKHTSIYMERIYNCEPSVDKMKSNANENKKNIYKYAHTHVYICQYNYFDLMIIMKR